MFNQRLPQNNKPSQPTGAHSPEAQTRLIKFDSELIPETLRPLANNYTASNVMRLQSSDEQQLVKWISKREPANEDFACHSEPYVIEGKENLSHFLFYGGLAGTGFPWKEIATDFNKEWGNQVEVYSLAGHDGTMETLADISHEDWVEDVINKAEKAQLRSGEPVVFFGFSTSAVAVLDAASRRPELFAALVLVAPPIRLRQNYLTTLLGLAERLDAWVPGVSKIAKKIKFPLASRKVSEGYGENFTKSPRMDWVPLSTLVSLSRLQKKARAAVPSIESPVLVIQGTEDTYVKAKTSERLVARLGSSEKDIVLFEGSPHPVMLSTCEEEFVKTVHSWLQRLGERGIVELDIGQKENPTRAKKGWKHFKAKFLSFK